MTKKRKNVQKAHPISAKISDQPIRNIKQESTFPLLGGNFYIPLFFILVITFIVYLPILHNHFVSWDDDIYIQNDPLIRSINLRQLFSHLFLGYEPLTLLAFAIQYHFYGLNETGFHAVNLALHLLNVVLVFGVILQISDKVIVAFIASLLFGIHPMHVESVAWATELKDVLYAFFFLSSYMCYLYYLKKRKRKFYFYCLVLFLLSLFSKGQAVSLTLILLLTDYFLVSANGYLKSPGDETDSPGKVMKISTRMWIEKIPFFFLSVIFGIVAVYGQKESGATDTYFTLVQRIIFAGYGYVMYVVKLVLPVSFCVYYPYPINNSSESIPFYYCAFLLLSIALIAGALYSLRFTKKIAFGFGFFTATVMLVLQLFSFGSNVMADRFSYLASVGIFYLAGEGIYWLLSKKKKRLAILLVSITTIFLSIKTYSRCEVWKDSFTLWSDVINQYPNTVAAYSNRASLLGSEGRYEEAIGDFNKAIELQPRIAKSYYNRGQLFMNQNKWDQALADFNRSISLKEGYKAYNNRGIVLANKKNYELALSDFNKAIALEPAYSGTYLNRGKLFMGEKKYSEALNDYNKAIELQPGVAQIYYDRARIEYNLGKKDSACLDLQKAISLQSPDAEKAYHSLCH